MPSKLLYPWVNRLVMLPRWAKRMLMFMTDALALPILIWAAFALRLSTLMPVIQDLWILAAAPLVAVPALYVAGFYKSIVRYLGAEVAWSLLMGITASVVILAAMSYMVPNAAVPRSVYLIWGALALLYLGGSRFVVRRFLVGVLSGRLERQPVAVFGAGSAGAQLIAGLQSSAEFYPLMAADDAKNKQGALLAGVPVVSRETLQKACAKGKVTAVLLALPSVSRARRMEIVRWLETLNVRVQTTPAVSEIASGVARIEDVKDVAIEDLLGRDAVAPHASLLNRCVANKCVLVTGAGGSIGSELCRQILRLKPQKIVLFEHTEYALYAIERELTAEIARSELDVVVHPELGSVVSRGMLGKLCREHGVHTVYHAAAYKHVPLVEENPTAGVRNNVFGTLEAAQGAESAGVEHFILVSTDKAVRPTNVMGATKRFAELLLQGMAQRTSSTTFSMVRFGNVLGSSGSVVPVFREQIAQGGPVTVTHPEVVRYFMTIPEAAQLVIQAGGMAKGGEVFVLDMGEPVKIVDLARTLIHLMGLSVRDAENPQGDIEVIYTGLRPGEKLYEELLIGEDCVGTEHGMIMQAHEECLSWDELQETLSAFRVAIEVGDNEKLITLLCQAVKGYHPKRDNVESVPNAGESAKVVNITPSGRES